MWPEMILLFFNKKENIVGKGVNAGYKHFSPYPKFLLNASFPGSIKFGIVR